MACNVVEGRKPHAIRTVLVPARPTVERLVALGGPRHRHRRAASLHIFGIPCSVPRVAQQFWPDTGNKGVQVKGKNVEIDAGRA